MRLTDLTPEEREVYRTAFATIAALHHGYGAAHAMREAESAVRLWRAGPMSAEPETCSMCALHPEDCLEHR